VSTTPPTDPSGAPELELEPGLYLLPTPAGAFHAVCSAEAQPLRRLLLALCAKPQSPHVDVPTLCRWLGTSDPQAALAVLQRAQSVGFVQGYTEPRAVSQLGVGHELATLLPKLSSVGRGMLVDWNGLALASAGVEETTADALAALSADLIAVQERHAERLARNVGLATHGWAAVNAFGSSRIGAWPLYIGTTRLMLVLLGEPQLNRSEFLALVWLLVSRYG
jgi:hypothetical protein